MSIFRRDNTPEPSPTPAPAARTPTASPKRERPPGGPSKQGTHVARGSKVVGEISGTAELVIDGEVDGEVELENRLVVGPEGRVDGKIVARAVQVGGKVHGNVRGLERVEVLASGSLEGDVVSPRVVIAEGAFFKGKVEMVDGSKAAEARKAATSQPGAPAAKPADAQAGSKDAGSRDAGSRDAGSRDAGSRDAGSRDAGSREPSRGVSQPAKPLPAGDRQQQQKGMPLKAGMPHPGGAGKANP